MGIKIFFVIVVLSIAIVGLGGFYIQLQDRHDKLQQDYSRLTEGYATLDASYALLGVQYSLLQDQNSSLLTQISSLNSQNNYLSEQGEIQYDLGYDLGYVNGENVGYSSGYDLGYVYGKSQGYDEGFDAGYAQGLDDYEPSPSVRNPTYEEVLDFIAWDTTDENEYTASYMCEQFSTDFKLNAIQYGYNCEMLYIEFTISAHAIVFFDTVNQGRIYVEPQTDDIVILIIGESYSALNGFIPIPGDMIVSFEVLWW